MTAAVEIPPRIALPDGLPSPRRYWAAATILCGISLTVLDSTIVNVALPTISDNFHAPASESVWVVTAYNLTIAMLLLPMSAVAERVGFRRMFAFGVVMFVLGSLACALSGSILQLSAARVLQAAGGATVMSMFGGMVRNIYPARLLGRGISLNATVVALMSVLGPSVGAVILAAAGWRWIFAVNVPVCTLVLCGLRALAEIPRVRQPLDWISALMSMAVLGTFIIGIDSLVSSLPRAVLLVAVSGVLAVLLVRRARTHAAPLVPVDLLRIKPIAFAVAASACTFAAQTTAYVALPFYFQHILNRPHIEVGMLMGAWPIGTASIALIAGKLSDRYSPALLSGIGASAIVVALLWLAALPATVSNAWIIGGMVLAGLGFGFFQTPNNRAMLGAAPRVRSGAAGGLQAVTRVFGQSFGTALLAVAYGLTPDHGALGALLFGAACAATAVAVNLVRSAKLAPSAS